MPAKIRIFKGVEVWIVAIPAVSHHELFHTRYSKYATFEEARNYVATYLNAEQVFSK